MKVLQIGQLPKEAGGNYTTGAAKVVFELSKKPNSSIKLYTYATNTKENKAKLLCHYNNEYLGYRYNAFSIVADLFCHPRETLKEWRHYQKIDHVNPLRFAFYKANIKRAIKIVRPDLIHVHSIGNVAPVRYAVGDEKIPILLTCHGIFYRGESQGRLRDIHLGNIKLADFYSGLTNESRSEYETLLGVPKDSVTVIPNGVDCKHFYYDEKKREEIRKEQNAPDNTLVFITVASVQERKGQWAFIKLLEKTDLNFQYWIIGGGPDVEPIQSYIVNHNLGSKVKLLGYKNSDELYGYYSAADIYAHVSIMEGQALCEIEASATGLRIIVNDKIKGTIPDLSSGDYFIINMNNPDIMSLCEWVNTKQANRHSVETLDWGNISSRYAKLYKKVIENWEA